MYISFFFFSCQCCNRWWTKIRLLLHFFHSSYLQTFLPLLYYILFALIYFPRELGLPCEGSFHPKQLKFLAVFQCCSILGCLLWQKFVLVSSVSHKITWTEKIWLWKGQYILLWTSKISDFTCLIRWNVLLWQNRPKRRSICLISSSRPVHACNSLMIFLNYYFLVELYLLIGFGQVR